MEADGILITEFAGLCIEMILKHGQTKFDHLVQDLVNSLDEKARARKVFWQGQAHRVDQVCRLTIPALYTVSLSVMLAARIPDEG